MTVWKTVLRFVSVEDIICPFEIIKFVIKKDMENKSIQNRNGKSETAYVNGNGNMHIKRKRVLADKNIHYEFNKFYNKEILKLLINVYEGKILLPELKVINMFYLNENGINSMPKHKDDDLWNTSADKVICEFEYEAIYYIVYFKKERDKYGFIHYYMDFGYELDSIPEEKIGHELLRLAFNYTSSYKKGCMEISFVGDRPVISALETVKIDPPKHRADGVFVRDEVKRDIERFIYVFKNFERHNFPLRYLLSGKPGLGKTEIVRTVIAECALYGNVIIPDKMNGEEFLMFDFAKLFRPAVICIDDLDLIFGTRDEGFSRERLGNFLKALDGILENKVFLIATTNDKKLVDIAASRPGRFDEIIDFGDFERRFYMDLIRQRTDDDGILGLFDEEVFDFMESKKVTGAYIVNLVKQLQIIREMNPDFSRAHLMEYLQRNYKGFYKSQVESKALGFN